jgi:hypothetical protein
MGIVFHESTLQPKYFQFNQQGVSMIKRYFNALLVFTLLIGLWATVPVRLALAECSPSDSGTSDDDIIVCSAPDHLPESAIMGDNGNDTIIIEASVDDDEIDVSGDGTLNQNFDDNRITNFDSSGSDSIIIDGTVDDVTGDQVNGNGANDSIIINGQADDVAGDDVGDDGGNDLIVVNGTAAEVSGDVADGDGGDDIIIINGIVTEEVNGDFADEDGGNDTITVNGTVYGNIEGDNVSGDGGEDTIIINGTVQGTVIGDSSAGCTADDTIVINGDVFGDVLADEGATCFVQGIRFDTPTGNDIVTIGAGGVSYGTTCGDISTTTVNYRQGTVGGLMDGGGASDTLVFALLTANGNDINTLAAELNGLNSASGSTEVGGESYTWSNFEHLTVQAIVYKEGVTRRFDDGVLLVFDTTHAPSGLDVCSGPKGFRVATIDYSQLEANASGQVFSAGNEGWYVKVFAVGPTARGTQYRLEVYDGSGLLQHDGYSFVH